jgi:hypothetical protein
MSQHGFESLAASARAGGDLSAILEAIQSGHIGTVKPTYAEKGMLWAKDIPGTSEVEIYFCYTDALDTLIGTVDTATGEFAAVGGGGGVPTSEVIETSGTWTRKAGCKYVKVYVTGGGGGGGGNSNNPGGSGATAIKVIDVSAIATATLTIGAAGVGGSGSGTSSGGASSWVDGTNTITGGGAVNNAESTATGGDINLVGVPGGEGGGGAGSFWGSGVNGNIAGRYWGSGGNSRNNSTGYAGKHGVIFIEEFY